MAMQRKVTSQQVGRPVYYTINGQSYDGTLVNVTRDGVRFVYTADGKQIERRLSHKDSASQLIVC
jgi:hypothetical protein